MNKEFFALLFNSLNEQYNISKAPPYIGRYDGVDNLPAEKCDVPFYWWQEEDGHVVFSYNTQILGIFIYDTLKIWTDNGCPELSDQDVHDCVIALIDLKMNTFFEAVNHVNKVYNVDF